MITVNLIRSIYGKRQTLGFIELAGERICSTLELPWKDNKRSISCIPEGIYTVVKRAAHETRPYEHFHVRDVPGRDRILIHRGNFVTQIKGCILPGKEYAFLNNDDLFDVVDSTGTLEYLLSILPDKFLFNIKHG